MANTWLARTLLLLLFLALLPALAAQGGGGFRVIDDFQGGLSPRWEEKEFKGRTRYQVVLDDQGSSLRAESRGGASGLVFRTEYRLEDFPVLSWRWKVENIIAASDVSSKSGDDYPARVYVVFPHWYPPKTRSINYIWSTNLAPGEFVPNSYFANAVMLACQSGEQMVGQWVQERRNVLEDYRRIFGEEPPAVGAIAVMSDTDNTGEAVVAYYDDIRIERE
ncbi:hypothetical protein DESUT3_30060 [Desulfuromonas versatilis]|uniref:DUF3047 domain-containing protein n=1 Tax=Desulfuromonas versatilis TaxID=2802975 RepID=A0ABN6E0T0_9BACT|nr:DUF3047 domain-containing protein [Desulfuromonas versatilis]BCR05937.1 hypothetical protein DESUT3_30060 [Desulfuromonas versatilis]